MFERVLVNRINSIYETSETQHGFTSGRSTISAWMTVKELVAQSTQKYVVGVFVDFRGAFDNLSWSAVISKLASIGCRELPIWRSYFANRKSCLVGRRDVAWRNAERGCPQGSICGPVIWNMMMDNLLNVLRSENIKHVAYADDLLLIIDGRSRTATEQAACTALQYAVNWGAQVGVDVSFRKTEAMMLRERFDAGRTLNIRLGESRVHVKAAVKYLGINVGAGMTFVPHLKEMYQKIVKIIAPLKRALRHSWGLRRKATIAWVNGLMKPAALYGAPIWCNTSQSENGRRMLIRVQRVVLVSSLRVCKTVSTVAMQVLAGCLPYDIEVLRLTARYKCKQAIQMSQFDLIDDIEAASADSGKLIEERAMEVWQRRWTSAEHGRVTHEYIPTIVRMTTEFDPP